MSELVNGGTVYRAVCNLCRISPHFQNKSNSLNFTASLFTGEGVCNVVGLPTTVITLGAPPDMTKGYAHACQSYISMSDFTRILVAACHELRHVEQEVEFYTKNDLTTYRMAVENVAHYGNRDYYMQTYNHNICEIDAERVGIAKARKILTDMLGSREKADALILDYADFKYAACMEEPRYFGADISDVDTLLRSLDKSFEKELNDKEIFFYDHIQRQAEGAPKDVYESYISSQNSCFAFADGWQQREHMCEVNMQNKELRSLINKGHILETSPFIKLTAEPEKTAETSEKPMGNILQDTVQRMMAAAGALSQTTPVSDSPNKYNEKDDR